MENARALKQQKVFERLAQRFSDKITEQSSNEGDTVLNDFLENAFGSRSIQTLASYARWLLDENSDNKRYIARNDDEVIGCQTELSCDFQHNNKQFKGVWAIDLSVRKDWQMKGLGVALIKKIMDEHDLVMGLGISQSAQAMFKRLQWQELGQVSCFLKPLSKKGFSNTDQNHPLKANIIYPALAQCFKLSSLLNCLRLSTYSVKTITPKSIPTEEIDHLYQSVAIDLNTLSHRKTAEYFKWRFFSQPFKGSEYEGKLLYKSDQLQGYVIYKKANWKNKQVLAICDYYGEKSCYPAIIAACEKEALKAKCDAMLYQGINPLFENRLRSAFFVERPHGDLFMVWHKDGHNNAAAIKDRNNWRITFSDSDMDFMFFKSA